MAEQFNITEYQETISSEDFRKKQLERLVDNYRLQKSISSQNRSILYAWSDPVKKQRLFDVVSEVYEGVLESDTQHLTIEDIVSRALIEQDKIDFLFNNRNSNYFPSGKVFELHNEHPTQKELVKGKYLGKRSINKQKTPMQTINYVYSAKSGKDKDDRLATMEERLDDLDFKLTLLVMNQNVVSDHINQHSQELSNIKERLSNVEDVIKDDRKLKLYALYTSTKDTPYSQLAKEIGVTKRTIVRWIKELRTLGVLSN